jgi:hypothetical protein
MMGKWIALSAAVPIGLLIIVVGIGALLPRDHVARGERTVRLSPDAVAARVRDVGAYPGWRSSVDRIDIVGRTDGQVDFVEHSGGDAIAFTMIEEAPGRRFRSAIMDPDLPFGGYWTITIDPAADGSRVAVEEHGHVRNPLFRFVSTIILGHNRTLETWLSDLDRQAVT